MSTVEKAAEKLKALQPGLPESPQVETAPSRPASTIERSQARAQAVEQAAVGQTAVEQPAVDEPVESMQSGHVDRLQLQRVGLLPADGEADERLAYELRRVKRPLLDNTIGKDARPLVHGERIVVTSAAPGEGKTFTAVNLALSLAREPDFEVLLVDGDMPKSDITRYFGLEGCPGLMDVLVDEQRPPAEVIVPTNVPNLLVVPAGQRHSLAAELFGSRRMDYVLEELSGPSRRRLLVFDSPPLLATSEAGVLVSHMGQVVMVVAAGRTSRQEVDAALQGLNASQYVGLILNKSRLAASESHYYGYGYDRQYAGDRQGEA